MKWVTWVNQSSGNPATRAHAIVSTTDSRTLCGATPGDLVSQAGSRILKCQTCKRALAGYNILHQPPIHAYDVSLARPH